LERFILLAKPLFSSEQKTFPSQLEAAEELIAVVKRDFN
jgi:hypothetical protein